MHRQNELSRSCPLPCQALYVHVPFCAAKCRYCAFYSVAFEPSAARRYLRALAVELDRRGPALSGPLKSIFIGGGTPTALGPELLKTLLSLCRPWVGQRTEVSVEANPATLTEPVVDVLAGGAVRRVSLGVQSFRDEELRWLGRLHTAEQARQAVGQVRSGGVGNVSLDLIYGLGNQTIETWRASLSEALALEPDHLSCYALSVEPGTPLERDCRAGTAREMPEDEQADCFAQAVADAELAGLEHYEISNFARRRRRCRHNLTYWHNEPYLGVGPGAASYLDGVRRTNAADVEAYADALLTGQDAPATSERLVGRAALAEAVMLALRLTDGLDRHAFARRWGADVAEAFPRSVSRYAALGALEVTPERIRIAPGSLFVANTILADILAEP